jgi:hypothetical protein
MNTQTTHQSQTTARAQWGIQSKILVTFVGTIILSTGGLLAKLLKSRLRISAPPQSMWWKANLTSGAVETIPASNLEQLSAIQEIASAAEHLSNLATVLQQTVNLFAVS